MSTLDSRINKGIESISTNRWKLQDQLKPRPTAPRIEVRLTVQIEVRLSVQIEVRLTVQIDVRLTVQLEVRLTV